MLLQLLVSVTVAATGTLPATLDTTHANYAAATFNNAKLQLPLPLQLPVLLLVLLLLLLLLLLMLLLLLQVGGGDEQQNQRIGKEMRSRGERQGRGAK